MVRGAAGLAGLLGTVARWYREGRLTIDDGTNDLVHLAFSGAVGRGEALGDGRGEGLARDSAEGWSAQSRAREARTAVRPSASSPMAVPMAAMQLDILLQHGSGGDGVGLMAGVERGVVWAKEEVSLRQLVRRAFRSTGQRLQPQGQDDSTRPSPPELKQEHHHCS